MPYTTTGEAFRGRESDAMEDMVLPGERRHRLERENVSKKASE